MTEPSPSVTIVIPARNEAGSLAELMAEIEAAMAPGGAFECIVVDDGSRDGTAAVVAGLAADRPWLRLLRHATSCGKSAAIRTAVRAARTATVVTLDADGQNDPVDLPRMLAALEAGGPRCGLVAAQRIGRRDTAFKRWQSRAANRIRARWLGDGTLDTNCGLKCFPRQLYLELPFFDGLHRFMPALVRREGLDVALLDVVDRPRRSGVSNYGFFDRLWVGIADLAGVYWLIRRMTQPPVVAEARE